jgi:hypothetical protein
MSNPYGPPQAPYPPYQQNITITTRPRQSCAVHAILALFTLGLGNIAYSIWHHHRYSR